MSKDPAARPDKSIWEFIRSDDERQANPGHPVLRWTLWSVEVRAGALAVLTGRLCTGVFHDVFSMIWVCVSSKGTAMRPLLLLALLGLWAGVAAESKKFSIQELLDANFKTKISNDIYLDPCKAGECSLRCTGVLWRLWSGVQVSCFRTCGPFFATNSSTLM